MTTGAMMPGEVLVDVGGGASPLVGDVMCLAVQLVSVCLPCHVFIQAA